VVETVGRRAKKRIEDVVQYALGHRTRVQILILLNESAYTTTELAEIIGERLSNVSNHIHRMLEDGSIEIAGQDQRGNVVQYQYKAVELPVYTTEEAEAMTPLQRQMTVGAIVQSACAEVLAALYAGNLANPKSILFWHWYNVDVQGRDEIDVETHRYLGRLREIEAAATNRRAHSQEEGISMLVNLAAFKRARKVRTHR
jgi:DNA-binding transcriptional ArsR family regulator